MDDAVLAVDAAMVRIRRSISERRLGKVAVAETPAVDLTVLAVLDAIDASPAPPAVGEVAERLQVDPSVASRRVAAAVDAGWVERVASQSDGRRIELVLTAAGRAVEDRVTAQRRARFATVLERFSDDDRARFAALLTAFVDGLDATFR